MLKGLLKTEEPVDALGILLQPICCHTSLSPFALLAFLPASPVEKQTSLLSEVVFGYCISARLAESLAWEHEDKGEMH